MIEPGASNESPQPQQRTSAWAVASLLCSVAICCPAMTIAAVLLGIGALVKISADPSMRGRNLARAGIAIGAATNVAWIAGMIWWHFNARLPMLHGPEQALQAGFAGDIAGFRAGFVDRDKGATDDQAAKFLNALSSRYGLFLSSTQDVSIQAQPAANTAPVPSEFRIPYTLRFDQAMVVRAEAKFVMFAESSVIPRPVFKWAWLRIIDPQQGDLVYPDSNGLE